MALALNVFKTVTKVATATTAQVYIAPVGYTGVVLLAQAANIGGSTRTITFLHERTVAGIAVTTEILKDFPIEASDTANLLSGKLVMESGDVMKVSADTSTDIKFLGSILETLN
jgi:hypothetical protein